MNRSGESKKGVSWILIRAEPSRLVGERESERITPQPPPPRRPPRRPDPRPLRRWCGIGGESVCLMLLLLLLLCPLWSAQLGSRDDVGREWKGEGEGEGEKEEREKTTHLIEINDPLRALVPRQLGRDLRGGIVLFPVVRLGGGVSSGAERREEGEGRREERRGRTKRRAGPTPYHHSAR